MPTPHGIDDDFDEIVRCRRLGDHYCEFGAAFIPRFRPLPSDEEPAGADAPLNDIPLDGAVRMGDPASSARIGQTITVV